jgi:hypothetical protein
MPVISAFFAIFSLAVSLVIIPVGLCIYPVWL